MNSNTIESDNNRRRQYPQIPRLYQGAIATVLLLLMMIAALSATVLWLSTSTGQPDKLVDDGNKQSTSSSDNSFVINNVRMFDGDSVHESASVLVRDGVIMAVGNITDVPDTLTMIDGSGKTLLPGLLDAHVHTFGTAREDALRFGVTTTIDLFSDPRQIETFRVQREAIDYQSVADTWSAGTLVTAAGGHGTQYGFPIPTLDSVADADAFIAARQAEGSDFIKLVVEDGSAYNFHSNTLDNARLEAAINAARARDLLTIVHVSTLESAKMALRAGADGLAHLFADAVADDEFIELAKQTGAFIVPTLAVIASISRNGAVDEWLARPGVSQFITSVQSDSLQAVFPPGDADSIQNALESTRRLMGAGVVILAGSDAPNPGTAHGIGVYQELSWLVKAGMTPLQALTAATTNTVDRFGIQDRGRIAIGQRADLLLIDGDPLADIEQLLSIAQIWKDGYSVERKPTVAAVESESAVADVIPVWQPVMAEGGVFEDFEAASTALTSWQVTTDAIIGGQSVAGIEQVMVNNNQVLQVAGEIKPGTLFPWAGVTFFTRSEPMQPVNAGTVSGIQFSGRGTPGSYQFMVFSGAQVNAMPVITAFELTHADEWQTFTVDLQKMDGVQLNQLRAFAWTAGSSNTEFSFQLDDIAVDMIANNN